MRVAAQDNGALIGGRQLHVQHLDGGELFEHGARRQARRQITQAPPQGDVQTVSQERDENMGLDAMLQLVMDGAQGQIIFEVLEGGFHLRQLDVKLPQFFRGSSAGNVGAQQISAFPFARLPQLVFAQRKGQRGFPGWHGRRHQACPGGIIVQGHAQFFEQVVALEFHRLQCFQPRPESF